MKTHSLSVVRPGTKAAAIGAGARQADAARALLKYLASPDAARLLKANGLEPPG